MLLARREEMQLCNCLPFSGFKSRWSTIGLESDGAWQYARAATNCAARARKSCSGGCLYKMRLAACSQLMDEMEVHLNSSRLCMISRRSPPAQNSMTR
jgi:hypothetical protein